jgi:hypothetical protein
MNDTVRLLEEVDYGCKMAINSINRIRDYPMDTKLSHVLDHYKYKHMEMQKQAADLLVRSGGRQKDPGMMVSTMAKVTTEVKMFMREDDNQIAKIMMDGCNMGIQSISEHINQYRQASGDGVALAKALVRTEEDFMCDLKQFL